VIPFYVHINFREKRWGNQEYKAIQRYWQHCAQKIERVVSLLFEFHCCYVRYDFHIKIMFGSSLPPVVCTCRTVHVLFTILPWYNWNIVESGVKHHKQHIYVISICLRIVVSITYCVFLRLVYRMLPVSLDCPLDISPCSVSSNVNTLPLHFSWYQSALKVTRK
jgi:hypothetical protein